MEKYSVVADFERHGIRTCRKSWFNAVFTIPNKGRWFMGGFPYFYTLSLLWQHAYTQATRPKQETRMHVAVGVYLDEEVLGGSSLNLQATLNPTEPKLPLKSRVTVRV